MNNYEHIVQGGVDALIEFSGAHACDVCSYTGDGTKQCNIGRCKKGIKEWLLQEYEAPDSWEKLLKDVDRAAGERGHNTRAYFDIEERGERHAQEAYEDIAKRIRALLEVEE